MARFDGEALFFVFGEMFFHSGRLVWGLFLSCYSHVVNGDFSIRVDVCKTCFYVSV